MFAQHQKVAIKFDPGAHLAFGAMGTGIIYCATKKAACVRVRESKALNSRARTARTRVFIFNTFMFSSGAKDEKRRDRGVRTKNKGRDTGTLFSRQRSRHSAYFK